MTTLPPRIVPATGWQLRFEVPGPLVAKARPRVTRRGTFMPDAHVRWEHSCIALARSHWPFSAPFDGPSSIHVVAFFKRPQRLMRRKDRGSGCQPHRGKPDGDNGLGLPADALVKAGVLVDDTQIADWVIRKRYVPLLGDGSLAFAPHTIVTLTPGVHDDPGAP